MGNSLDALGGGVAAPLILRRLAVHLDQLGVVDLTLEGVPDRLDVVREAVARQLHATTDPPRQVVNECGCFLEIAWPDPVARDELRVSVNCNPRPHVAPAFGFLLRRDVPLLRSDERPNL